MGRQQSKIHATSGAVIAVTALFAFAPPGSARAEEAPPTASAPAAPAAPAQQTSPPPIWVPNVIRIDRNAETRQRIVDEAETRRRFQVVTPLALAEDGSFATTTERIRLAGIRLPDRKKMCETTDGRRWSCGVRAHATFVATMAGKRIECRPRTAEATQPLLVDCRLDGRPIAEGLVAAGWADIDEATADAGLKRVKTRAVEEKRGLWSTSLP